MNIVIIGVCGFICCLAICAIILIRSRKINTGCVNWPPD